MSWKIDNAHSLVEFSVRHMMISTVRGRFERFSGTVEFNENDPTASSVDVQIEAASINTNESQRDNHLRSADFFDAEKFPYLSFKSTRVEKIDENNGRIYGDLTIRDISHPVVLETEYNGQAKSPWGSTSAGFTANTKINRKDWNLVWNQALETGGMLVGDEIKIHIELEIVKVPQEDTETASVA
ncbi:MAG: YceI family protein [Chloroflexi bacterium]|jgi:polyisoprenoid-binding protein YceI|nr:YceI family protein [Chloroflexota bacterium]